MKKVFFIAMIATAFMLTSFTNMNHKLNINLQPSIASASFEYNQAIPINAYTEYTLEDYPLPACSGEFIYLNANITESMKGVYIPSTNTLKVVFHNSFKGQDSYGEITGDKYIIREVINSIQTTSYSDNKLTLMGTLNTHIISTNSDDDFYARQNYSATLDLVTNEFTYNRYELIQECR